MEKQKRIGGVLILVGLGLGLAAALDVITVFTYTIPNFFNGTWLRLFSPSSIEYVAVYRPALVFETIMAFSLAFLHFALIYLFLQRDVKFPKLYIPSLVMSVLFQGTLLAILARYPNPQQDILAQQGGGLFRIVIGSVIWIPYMLYSKRVRETFLSHTTAERFLKPVQIYAFSISLSAIFLTWGLLADNRAHAFRVQSPDALAMEFVRLASEMNARGPVQIDADTRLDSVSAGPGLRMTYNYSLTKISTVQIDKEKTAKNLQEKNELEVCESHVFRPALQQGAVFLYSYRSGDGDEIAQLKVDAAACMSRAK